MSGSLAIAAVTAVLKDLVQQNVDGVEVRMGSPRPPSAGDGSQVNIFLYQVNPNPHWRNEDLPTRRADGSLATQPTIALDLYYLIAFYGDDAELVPQRLMGRVMSALHAGPIMDRRYVAEVIGNLPFLSGSPLARQIETVKLTPVSLSLDELSKLWSLFSQTTYALSIAYQASVVFVEADRPASTALPVRDYNLYVDPIKRPAIQAILAGPSGNDPILSDSTIVIRGRHLRGEVTKMRIGVEERVTSPDSDDHIEVPLSDYTNLRAGVQGVQIVHERLLGTPRVPHLGMESNAVPIMLRPTIREDGTDAPRYDAASQQIILNIDPLIATSQRVMAFLNGLVGGRTVALTAADLADDSHSVNFPALGVRAGRYLVRVQIDGAESLVRAEGADHYDRPVLAVEPLVSDAGAAAPRHDATNQTLSLEVTPPLAVDQVAVLILQPLTAGADQRFDVAPRNEETSQITVHTPGLAAGTYLVRIAIDGVQSPATNGDKPQVQVA